MRTILYVAVTLVTATIAFLLREIVVNVEWSGIVGLSILGITVLILLFWFFRNRRGTSRIKRGMKLGWVVTILAVAGYLILAYHYYPWEQKSKLQSFDPKSEVPARITDNTFVTVVRPGQPARVVMAPGWMMVWWGDKSRFTSHAVWEGADKVRIFSVREGVEHAWIKIHTYYDPDPLWYTRQ
jgi:heme/copper-type cytochrome/quinol oxidase subunit 2